MRRKIFDLLASAGDRFALHAEAKHELLAV
jgi:hypothetical protein